MNSVNYITDKQYNFNGNIQIVKVSSNFIGQVTTIVYIVGISKN